VKKVKINWLLC